MTYLSSDELDAYIPAYDAIPEEWEDAKGFLTEQLKMIANMVNLRTIGWMLDQELLSGQQFIPGATSNHLYRSVFRKVIEFGPIVAGVTTRPHGVTVDANFTLIHLWASLSNVGALTGKTITGSGTETVTYDATNIIITATASYDRVFAFFEYVQEL